jgi:hypothetical protein
MAGISHPTFGEGFEPFTVKISFSYTLPFPKFLRRYKTKDDWQRFIWDKRASPVASMVRFDDPVGLPPNGVVRYLLKIKDFCWAKSADNEMPANHALVRLVVHMGDAGVLRSDNIYLNSIQ